jgi:glycosyltransferase involved in cell wall biosynthesis
MASLAPTVTVIIPTYNSSRTLRSAIQSVLLQTLSDFEIWVVGDGCTDDSGEVVASFPDHRLHWVNLPSNFGGPSVPRNEGWARANGRYIAYLGHDDLWFPGHLAEVVATVEREQAVFACSLGAVLGPGAAMAAFSIPRDPRRGGELSPSNWLHRCDLDQRIGRWSINSRWADDREFLRRVFEARMPIAFCRQLTVLKYPSTVWRLYDPGRELPQESAVDRLRRDPRGFRDEILLELATAFSDSLIVRRPGLRGALRMLLSLLVGLWGIDRWPVNRLLYWFYRRRAGLGSRSRPHVDHRM